MNLSKPSIYNQLLLMQIGESAPELTFLKRLQRENDWSETYSDRVVTEYKKFIYLAHISKDAVTPSDAVDQAWHLHLTYTDSYWNKLCKGILKEDLHHYPTMGGDKQRAKFIYQYAETLALYEKVFEQKPHCDIWPSPSERFNSSLTFVRINRNAHFLIPRPRRFGRNFVIPLLLSFFVLACTGVQEQKSGWFWFAIIASVIGIFCIFTWIAKKFLGKPDNSKRGGDLGCGGCGGV